MEHIKAYFNNLLSNSPLLTISIITCFGYLFAYQYEIGAAKYYSIPSYLVQIDLLQVILNAVLMYITVFFLGLSIYLIVSKFHHSLSQLNPNQTIKTKSDIITSRISAALLVLLLLIIIPNLLGQQWAGEKRSYFIFQKNDKNYAIVKIYGDLIIALAFDKKRVVLKNDILLLPKDQSINGTVKYFHNIKVEN
jgi:hypothetical protein